jgi:hypothetical protein
LKLMNLSLLPTTSLPRFRMFTSVSTPAASAGFVSTAAGVLAMPAAGAAKARPSRASERHDAAVRALMVFMEWSSGEMWMEGVGRMRGPRNRPSR